MNPSLLRLRAGVAILGAVGTGTLAAQTPVTHTPIRMIATPSLSPDGQQILFAWDGDLWSAPSTGGAAKRLMQTPARESRPLLSADGKTLVFNREVNGALQVFARPLAGGEARQLTFHSEGSTLNALVAGKHTAIACGPRERGNTRPERLFSIDLITPQREQVLFDAAAHDAAVSADGKRVLFCTDGEPWFRKGYRGSRASKIWSTSDNAQEPFEALVHQDAAAESPLIAPDGKAFYYVSENAGTKNLWSREFTANEGKAITFFQDDGVRSPALSADGSTLVFLRGLETYRMSPGKEDKPVALEFWHEEKPAAKPAKTKLTQSTDFAFTPQLDVVLAAGGELWFQPLKGGPAVRLTETAEEESGLSFSADGRWLYYLADDGMEANFWRACLKEGGNWNAPDTIERYQITIGQSKKGKLLPSPDGKRIAWTEGRGDLYVADADGGSAKKLFANTKEDAFAWSPDSSAIAFIASKDVGGGFGLWFTKADASHAPVAIIQDKVWGLAPTWSPDSKHLALIVMRDAQLFLQILDLDPEAYRRGYTEQEAIAVSQNAKPMDVQWLQNRAPVWMPDSSGIITATGTQKEAKWQVQELASGQPRELGKIIGQPVGFINDACIAIVDGAPALWQNSKITRIPLQAEMAADPVRDHRFAFRNFTGGLRYALGQGAASHHNWSALLAKYEDAAANAVDEEASRTIGDLLKGEVGAFASQAPAAAEAPAKSATAHLGLCFRNGSDKDALVIDSVIAGSPAAQLPDPPKPGETVTRIDDLKVNAATPLHSKLNGNIGKPVSLTLTNSSGKKRTLEVRGISYHDARELDRSARAAAACAPVEGSKPDKIAYVTAANANGLTEATKDADACILDLRLSESSTEDETAFDALPPKPLIVLCDQNTAAEAEALTRAIQGKGNIPIIGAPTAGNDPKSKPVKPTTEIWNQPADEAAGSDRQLNAAVTKLREAK